MVAMEGMAGTHTAESRESGAISQRAEAKSANLAQRFAKSAKHFPKSAKFAALVLLPQKLLTLLCKHLQTTLVVSIKSSLLRNQL